MNLQQYIENAIRTESRIPVAKVNDQYAFRAVLEAFAAASILLDLYKKNIYYGKEINSEKWLNAINDLTSSVKSLRYDVRIPDKAIQDVVDVDTRILHAILGIATESGELVDVLLKHLNHVEQLDPVNLREEGLGDVCWYQAILADALQTNWEADMERNIAKLRARYPDRFTSENAINRDLTKERQILEGGDARMRAEEGYPFGGSDYQ